MPQSSVWPSLPTYVSSAPCQKVHWPWHYIIICVFIAVAVSMFISLSPSPPGKRRKIRNFDVHAIFLDLEQCLTQADAQEICFYEWTNNKWRPLGNLWEPKLLEVSRPSPEVLSILKNLGLGKKRMGNVTKLRVGRQCMGEISERTQGTVENLGEEDPRRVGKCAQR